MKLITKISLIAALPIILLASACSKEYLDTKPNNSITTDNYYQTEGDAITAVNAAYNPLQGLYNGAAWQLLDIMSDDADKGGGGANDGAEVYQLDYFTLDANNPMISNYWAQCYQGIYRANLALSKIPGIPVMKEEVRNRCLGECYFLRGYYHYMLVRLYGDVPLVTSALTLAESLTLSRTNKDQVYTQIVADLIKGGELLPKARYTGDNAGRVNGLTSKGLLASVYLTMNRKTDAAAAAQEVISAGVYSLNTDYADNFNLTKENGVESLFEVQYRNGGQQWQFYGQGSVLNCFLGPRAQNVVASSGYGFDVPTAEFVADYETNATGAIIDNRVNRTMWRAGDKDGTYTHPSSLEGSPLGYNVKKYYIPISNSASDAGGWSSAMNVPVLRYAEILLIAAEANGPAAGKQYIDQVRTRAGLPALKTGMTDDEYTAAVFKERRLEMGFEMHRWFDLLRHPDPNYFITKLNAQQRLAAPKHRFMPIPQAEIDKNPALSQNTGY
jgi:starch-binding outer membrane protein, SusD/RagB family